MALEKLEIVGRDTVISSQALGEVVNEEPSQISSEGLQVHNVIGSLIEPDPSGALWISPQSVLGSCCLIIDAELFPEGILYDTLINGHRSLEEEGDCLVPLSSVPLSY